jgi:hypothetical protein
MPFLQPVSLVPRHSIKLTPKLLKDLPISQPYLNIFGLMVLFPFVFLFGIIPHTSVRGSGT